MRFYDNNKKIINKNLGDEGTLFLTCFTNALLTVKTKKEVEMFKKCVYKFALKCTLLFNAVFIFIINYYF